MKPARIQPLSPLVSNQIAAGEVIERPASVVKELLENALDAKADTISIEIGFGGLNQIKISDNGTGIVEEDLPLAVAAHATSKITTLTDLYTITSMGFRGEALASIAAVSKLSLSSKTHEQEHAMMLRLENGVANLSPCARAQGTTVEVRDLFFNALVRKKFLKSPRTEYQAIEMVVKRFALSAPHIAMTLKHEDKQLLVLPSATCEKTKLLRLRRLLGKEFTDNAIYLDVEQGDLHIQGWISNHSYERSQSDKQWIYVNQRMVKDKLINHALKQAYDGLLYSGRYPACVLYITIKPEYVDVNVHPTKHEVRFQQPRLVHDFIFSTLSQALARPAIKALPQKVEHIAEVREIYIKQPLRPVMPPASNNWIVLNRQFVLIIIEEQTYLIDVERVYQHYLSDLLAKLSLPLANRLLLVPLTFTIEENKANLFKQYQPILMQLGLQFDWVNEITIVMRSIPMLLPQLDIQKFIQSINNSMFRQDELWMQLVTCQSVDAYQLCADAKTEIMDHLKRITSACLPIPGCLHLDPEKCRELVHA